MLSLEISVPGHIARRRVEEPGGQMEKMQHQVPAKIQFDFSAAVFFSRGDQRGQLP